MTPEREAQMRELYEKLFPRPSKFARSWNHEAWHYRLEGFLACARALEPMVRDGERYRFLRDSSSSGGILRQMQDGLDGAECDTKTDAAMSAALEDGNATE